MVEKNAEVNTECCDYCGYILKEGQECPICTQDYGYMEDDLYD